ncbi:class C sortase [Corynebacterium poyangense]|uniref:Class C sortase n=1 Tax=Corynebacterium poyangense TaxID=2684405 RepID=A0A7H0SLQ5_9CORY|nr:class C sortase [Corynebacterium poyangense]QNQ89480.1 class C sortase [Corynebacterium poyangense]
MHSAKSKKISVKNKKNSLIPALIVVLSGLLLVIYPVVATLHNNYRQAEAAKNYSDVVQQMDDSTRLAKLREASEYNRLFPQGPLLDPWLARVTPDNENYQLYLQKLDSPEAMARLKIPKIKLDLPIYHGSDEKVLSKGIGHLYGSSLPVGGEHSHAVLTGHTGLSNATLFDDLTEIHEGDSFYIEVLGERLKYEVHQIDVVLPNETEGLAPVAGEDLVTLITCTPYGQNTHRLLVTGHRVPLDDTEADEVFNQRSGLWTWWMTVVTVMIVGFVIVMAWWLWRYTKQQRRISDVSPDSSSGS